MAGARELSELAGRLDAIAGEIALPLHLIEGERRVDGACLRIHADPLADFCRPCGSALARLLKAHGLKDAGCRHCEVCGSLLEKCLTDNGAEEAAHYSEHPPKKPLACSDAYHLARIADSESLGNGFLLRLRGWLDAHDAARRRPPAGSAEGRAPRAAGPRRSSRIPRWSVRGPESSPALAAAGMSR